MLVTVCVVDVLCFLECWVGVPCLLKCVEDVVSVADCGVEVAEVVNGVVAVSVTDCGPVYVPGGSEAVAIGAATGVDDTTGEEGRPVPTELTAETWKSYDTPFVRPVTVALVAVLTPSANVVNGVVPVVLYCMM